MSVFDYTILTRLLADDRIAFKRHALIRMQQRHIRADDVKAMLQASEVIEHYDHDHPLPSVLLLGMTPKQRALHAVVAVDPDGDGMVWVITVYEPDQLNWQPDLRTRRDRHVVSIM